MSFFSNLAKKVYSKGSNFASKVRNNFLHGASKVRSTIHDVRSFIEKVQKIAPVATQIVDDVTNLIPGAAPIKQGLKYGLSAFDTISSLTGPAENKILKAESFARNPNVINFKQLFNP